MINRSYAERFVSNVYTMFICTLWNISIILQIRFEYLFNEEWIKARIMCGQSARIVRGQVFPIECTCSFCYSRRWLKKEELSKTRDNYLSEPWLLTLPGSRGGPGPRCARAWGPQGAASFPAAGGSWLPLPPARGPSRSSPGVPGCPWSPLTWSCPLVGLRSLRSIRASVALKSRKTHQSRHSTCISSVFASKSNDSFIDMYFPFSNKLTILTVKINSLRQASYRSLLFVTFPLWYETESRFENSQRFFTIKIIPLPALFPTILIIYSSLWLLIIYLLFTYYFSLFSVFFHTYERVDEVFTVSYVWNKFKY